MRVLVLGGTAWLGHAIAAAHLAAGHDVTCVARGAAVPDGATLVQADRDDGADALAALTGEWDEVVDVTRIPAHASAAAQALAERARHWTLVSTVSVHRDVDRVGDDESAPLLEPAAEPDDYGRAKVHVEQTMQQALGARLLVLRPGLIVGPGDPSDRYGSWAARAALAGDDPLLVPERDVAAQVIDVRDLADAVVDLGTRGVVGVRTAVGPVSTLHGLVDEIRAAAGHAGPVVLASDADLERLDVQPWGGPRSLALWLPVGYDGHGSRSNAALLDDGVHLRPTAETARDVVADERERGLERARASGISRADELAVLAALAGD
ncbi:NAD-dependent epimerase/dehydratase family protein [Agrococcus jejuensis]|uniref:Nucleoside-diphosphate-sugar epimerase n=1 Tax=Agrococcus jejuensis TaxID=399736 RepID=A0A1G8ALG1_9MICO|nr:NAD-dependent epimerase/dehydratase family protein [Agrococcus jejuensis]SDH21160.1 Nucleoside-diphosphate-sugar epimerase [Agrococcus jejuensis]